jgi:hypothetical protein
MDFLAFQAITIVCATAAFVASLRFVRQYLESRNDRRIALRRLKPIVSSVSR